LRGGASGPNYSREHVANVSEQLAKSGVISKVMVLILVLLLIIMFRLIALMETVKRITKNSAWLCKI
jgi:hypothetical protein